jgi:two-component system LytT family response regulator
MRVLLVDDEQLALDRLRTFFADISGVEVVGEANDGDEALRLIEEQRPDIVILDIQMPGKSGLRTAASIDVDPKPELVFVTAHEHYAPDAFEIDAADYLLKPIRFDRLRQAIERAGHRRRLREQAERAGVLEAEVAELRAGKASASDELDFWVPDTRGQTRVPIDSIDWIEAARDYVLLHTEVRSYLLRITMAALEERLAGGPLVRAHRSAFVRPDKVAEVNRTGRRLVLKLTDGTSVQVGPSYIAGMKEALGIA